jgi:ABC-type uncharacterized transport system substrate-binding protein
VAQHRRRQFLLSIPVLLGAPLAAAQSQRKVFRLGFLTSTSHPAREEGFRRELHRLGYVEQRNLITEYRSADGDFARLPALAAELAGLKVDVLVAVLTQAAVVAKRATSTIPVVIVGVSDPVGSGLVSSLGRPGGNVTGTSGLSAAVVGKQLEIFHEALPRVSRVTALWNPANSVFQKQQVAEARAAAPKLKLQLQFVEARSADELDRALATIAQQPTQALFVLADPLFGPMAARIAGDAVTRRLPTVSGPSEYADAGMLLTYGPNYSDLYTRAAAYVDKIVKGAKPADLPIEQPTKFELVVNLRTARALGLAIPQTILLRADRVID